MSLNLKHFAVLKFFYSGKPAKVCTDFREILHKKTQLLYGHYTGLLRTY